MDEETGSMVVVTKNVANLHAEPDSDTEVVNQNLMGEMAAVLERRDGWLYIDGWDDYRGWIRSQHVLELSSDEPGYASAAAIAVVTSLFADIFSSPDPGSDILTKATISVELELADETAGWLEVILPDGRRGFVRRSDAITEDRSQTRLPAQPSGTDLVNTAKRFVGVPYLWGGVSPFGIDCSGFMQLIYRIHGVKLLRDAHIQADDLRVYPVEKDELRAGDLVFFARRLQDGNPRITHVGMSMGGYDFIHSGGMGGVYMASLVEDKSYGPTYWGARRIDFLREQV